VSDRPDPEVAATSRKHWMVRIVVWAAFGLTVWWCGPKAADVLAARFERAAKHSPLVALDSVGFREQPPWLQGDAALLLAVSTALSPWLSDEVPILDDATIRVLRDGLVTVPWVEAATIERKFPDQLRLMLELRQPVLAVRSADGAPLCLCDRRGTMLPWVDTPLPVLFLHREGGAPTMKVEPGQTVAEARVRAAVAIAIEWRDEFAPQVAGCPQLLEIDAMNLGERWVRGPTFPEVRVRLARRDGAGVLFGYDRPVDSQLPRVPTATKAAVLTNILKEHPGLDGLVAGDLRFSRRWADYLQPRPTGMRDPNEPWNELMVPK
jgi:hypothetical protein